MYSASILVDSSLKSLSLRHRGLGLGCVLPYTDVAIPPSASLSPPAGNSLDQGCQDEANPKKYETHIDIDQNDQAEQIKTRISHQRIPAQTQFRVHVHRVCTGAWMHMCDG